MACVKPRDMTWRDFCYYNPECCSYTGRYLTPQQPPPLVPFSLATNYYPYYSESQPQPQPGLTHVVSLFDDKNIIQQANIEDTKAILDALNVATKDILNKAIEIRKSGGDLIMASILHEIVNLRVTSEEKDIHFINLTEQVVLFEKTGDNTRAKINENLIALFDFD